MALSVGIDLSTRSCGMAIVMDDFLLASWQLKAPSGADKWQRLRYIGEAIRGRFPHDVDVVVFENVRLFHGGRISIEAIRDLARLQGVVSYLALGIGAKLVEVSVQHWRRAVLGDGRAQKGDVVAWATDFAQRDGLGTDEAEAIALARYGILWLNQSQRQLKRSIRRSSKEVSTRNGKATRPRSRSLDRRGSKRQK